MDDETRARATLTPSVWFFVIIRSQIRWGYSTPPT